MQSSNRLSFPKVVLALLMAAFSSTLVAQDTAKEKADAKYAQDMIARFVDGVSMNAEQAKAFGEIQNAHRLKQAEFTKMQDELLTDSQRIPFENIRRKNHQRKSELSKLKGEELEAKKKEFAKARQTELKALFSEEQLVKFKANQKAINEYYNSRGSKLRHLLNPDQMKTYNEMVANREKQGFDKGTKVAELMDNFIKTQELSEEYKKKFLAVEGKSNADWRAAQKLDPEKRKTKIEESNKARTDGLKEFLSQEQMKAYWKYRKTKDQLNNPKKQ